MLRFLYAVGADKTRKMRCARRNQYIDKIAIKCDHVLGEIKLVVVVVGGRRRHRVEFFWLCLWVCVLICILGRRRLTKNRKQPPTRTLTKTNPASSTDCTGSSATAAAAAAGENLLFQHAGTRAPHGHAVSIWIRELACQAR